MTDRELFKITLDALEKMKSHSYLRLDYAEEAIAALSDRLAQPEQEPVAWELRMGTKYPSRDSLMRAAKDKLQSIKAKHIFDRGQK